MTKDEALKMCLEYIETDAHERKYVRHAIKEALAQPEQEPVAWMRQDGQRVTTASDRHNYPDYETRYSIPLYTTPPQRTWVEVESIKWEGTKLMAKLKEKNT